MVPTVRTPPPCCQPCGVELVHRRFVGPHGSPVWLGPIQDFCTCVRFPVVVLLPTDLARFGSRRSPLWSDVMAHWPSQSRASCAAGVLERGRWRADCSVDWYLQSLSFDSQVDRLLQNSSGGGENLPGAMQQMHRAASICHEVPRSLRLPALSVLQQCTLRLSLRSLLWACVPVPMLIPHLRFRVFPKDDLLGSLGFLTCSSRASMPQSRNRFPQIVSNTLVAPRSEWREPNHGACGCEWITVPPLWAGVHV